VGKQKDKEIDSELEQKTHHFPDFLGEKVCHPMATIKLSNHFLRANQKGRVPSTHRILVENEV